MKYYGKIQDPKDLVTKEYVDEADSNNAVYFGIAKLPVLQAQSGKFTVTIPNITELKDNIHICVSFPAYTQSANPTLNVNGLGAIPIMYMGGTASVAQGHFNRGVILDLVYISNFWVIVGGAHAYVGTYGVTTLSDSAEDASDNLALTPSALNNVAQYMISGYEPFSSTATYEVGDRVRENGRIYECINAITSPRGFISNDWTIVEPIVSMIENKYTKPANGIPDTDFTDAVRTSLGKADTALQQHQSLTAYRTAAAQDVIDQTQTTAINAKSTIEVWRLN